MSALWNHFPGGRTGAALLITRLIVGLAFVLHGLPKIQSLGGPMGWMGPDAPVPGFLQGLAALAELGGGLALIFGFLTPLAALGILCTMAYALFMVHLPAGASFVSNSGKSYETAGVFFVLMIALLLSGPGAYSLDALLFGRRRDTVGNAVPVR
jgi:putative oxidoreductase